MRHTKPTFVFLWIALVCAVAAAACSINSQPVPPGAQAVGEDGGAFGGGDGAFSDAGAPPKGSDGGVTSTPPDGGNELDGGETDASDGGDGGDDAGEDAGDGG